MLLKQRHHLGEEGLQALGADVAAGLPCHAQSCLEGEAVEARAAPGAADGDPLAAAQDGNGVLAVAARGQAEGIQDLSPFLLGPSRVSLCLLARKFVPVRDAHRSSLRLPPRGQVAIGKNFS